MTASHPGEEGRGPPSTKMIFALYWCLADLKVSWRFKIHCLKLKIIPFPPPPTIYSNLVHLTWEHGEKSGRTLWQWLSWMEKKCETGLLCTHTCHGEVVDQSLCLSAKGARNSQMTALVTSSQDLLGSSSITLSRKLLFLLSKVQTNPSLSWFIILARGCSLFIRWELHTHTKAFFALYFTSNLEYPVSLLPSFVTLGLPYGNHSTV